MTPSIPVGTITLLKQTRFEQYSECAAWTDYVTCEPQTVELRYVDNYWMCATFDGVLTASSFPPGSRIVGLPAKASFQTQAFGLPINLKLFSYEITHPDYCVATVGRYEDGRPMIALRTLKQGSSLVTV